MREAKERHNYVLDPHTAVATWLRSNSATQVHLLCVLQPLIQPLPDAVVEATGTVPTHPSLDALVGLEQRKKAH